MINTIIYVLISFIGLFLCGKISYNLNLLDIPNERKIHTKATAYTGGIAISIILLCALVIFDSFNPTLSLIISISFLISVIGLIDDKYNLNIGGKLSLQIIPIFYLVIFENLALEQIGDYYYFNLELGTFAIPFTFLSVLFLINAFNYFDGIDGLLGSSSISVLAILYFLATQENTHFLNTEQDIKFFLIVIAIPIIVFLFFNLSVLGLPKIFLGDSGSLLLGYILSFILIYFANQNFIHPILLAWSVAIFVYEFLAINIIRLKSKKQLFKAGNDHLHHILLGNYKSIFLTNFIISIMNIILFIFGYLSFLFINQLASLFLFILLFIPFFFVRNIFSN